MGKRICYHVVFRIKEKCWFVKQAGDVDIGGRFTTKDNAISFARKTAKANQPSQIMIHTKDGRF